MAITTKSGTLAIGFCFPIVGAILCTARVILRRRRGVRLELDDLFAVTAWVLVTGMCATLVTGVYIGAFFLTDASNPERLAYQEHLEAQISGAFQFFYNFSSASIKLSLLFFFRRIFVGHVFNIVSWTLVSLTAVYAVYGFIAPILYCGWHIHDNFEGPWDSCPMWGFKLQFVTFVLDNFIDFCIILMPIPFLLKLHTDATRKVLLVVVFAVGGFAFVASLMNTVYQFIIMTDLTALIGQPGSPTIGPTSNNQLLLLNWPAIEVGVGLIACNLPSMSVLATRFLSAYLLREHSPLTDSPFAASYLPPGAGGGGSTNRHSGLSARSPAVVPTPDMAHLEETFGTRGGGKFTFVEHIESTQDVSRRSSFETVVETRGSNADNNV